MHRSLRLARAGVVIGAFASMALAPAASADLDEVNTKKLREGVTVNGILQHERALQTISNMNGGTRASGTAGYRASLNYVKDRLTKAGYTVKRAGVQVPVLPRAGAGRAVAGLTDGAGLRDGHVRLLRHR